ncbi:hypothetical protein WJX77_011501 [Trebouxia sp. C0004]
MTVMAYNVPGATVSPDTLCCSHCRSKGMIVVRLASNSQQLKCWLKILGSNPTCKALANVEIEWPNIIHGFCASQRVDPATLLRGLTREALKEQSGLTHAENVAFSVVDKPKGKSKATRHGSQPHFVLARWWFVHPHVAPRFAEFVRDSLHHADGLQDFMPKPEH